MGQVLHVDYEDTLSPFARFTLIHLITAIVVHMDQKPFQMDIKTTFLIKYQDEEIYIDHPWRIKLLMLINKLTQILIPGKKVNEYVNVP